MIPLYHRCTEVDVPISYNHKIYNERQEISCRRVDRLVSPSWFVADLTVAEMAYGRDDRTPKFPDFLYVLRRRVWLNRESWCVLGPNSIAKSVVEPDNSGRYTVYYTPVEVGLYNIAVKWNGKEIEGILVLRIFSYFLSNFIPALLYGY